jgi:hypothetical protein
VPGTGTPATQVHDNNKKIPVSGLFWTLPAHGGELQVSRDGRRAVLELRDVAVIDSFQFFGPTQVPASVSLRVEWRASGPFARRGAGAGVPDTDIAAFIGDIAPARSTGSFTGEEWGFAFASERASTDRGYAQMGRTRNGAFLPARHVGPS